MRVVIILNQESDQRLYKPALESLRSQIRASTTSMTSVPKPLKFLRPHYDSLKEVHEKIKDDETKVAFRNYLSSERFGLIVSALSQFFCGFDLLDTDKSLFFIFIFVTEILRWHHISVGNDYEWWQGQLEVQTPWIQRGNWLMGTWICQVGYKLKYEPSSFNLLLLEMDKFAQVQFYSLC